MEFSASGKLTTALNRAIEAVAPDQWKPCPWEKDAHWREFPYHPKDWPGTFRMIVKRIPHYEGNQRVIGEFRYNPVLTNRRGAGCGFSKHHLGRGGAENYIEEFKNGLGARSLPSHNFTANWAWLVIAQLAYNLAQWLKLLALPAKEARKQIKHLRLHLAVRGRKDHPLGEAAYRRLGQSTGRCSPLQPSPGNDLRSLTSSRTLSVEKPLDKCV